MGPTYSIFKTFPHSGQRSTGRSRDIWPCTSAQRVRSAHSGRGTYGEPDRNMGIGRVAGAASILLVTKRLDNNRVVERACNPAISKNRFEPPVAPLGKTDAAQRTFAGRVQWPHVEDINALHLSQDLQPLETGGLLEVGGDGTRWSSGADEVHGLLDLYYAQQISLHSHTGADLYLNRTFDLLDLGSRRVCVGGRWCDFSCSLVSMMKALRVGVTGPYCARWRSRSRA
jgi:hypothetical protein